MYLTDTIFKDLVKCKMKVMEMVSKVTNKTAVEFIPLKVFVLVLEYLEKPRFRYTRSPLTSQAVTPSPRL